MHPTSNRVSLALGLLAAMASVATMLVLAPTAGATTRTLTFTPVADTYVSAASPTKAYGTSSYATVDGDPTKQALLRFAVSGTAGADVVDVRLRMYQVDRSAFGGDVSRVSSNSWTESTTWNTRPSIDGPVLGSFSDVASGTWYEISLGAALSGDGTMSLAITMPGTNGAKWATRESSTAPQLLVVTESGPSPTTTTTTTTTTTAPPPTTTTTTAPPTTTSCAPTQVAGPTEGSSNPTRYGGNHRLARTAGGRLLALHGRHARGAQLAWRDGTEVWQRTTRGEVLDGMIADGQRTGDLSSSIAVLRELDGTEHAWVVWSGNGSGDSSFPVVARHLTELDAVGGPVIGPAVLLSPAAVGVGRADVVVESAPGAEPTAVVTWVRPASTGTEVVVAGLRVGAPGTAITGPFVVQPGSVSPRASLVSTPDGTALVVRSVAGRLQVLRHAVGASLATWGASVEGIKVSGSARVNGVALASGDVLATAERDTTNHVVIVQRFDAAGGAQPVELELTGYLEPTIASDGSRAWLLSVRTDDGLVISRQRSVGTWAAADRVEMGPEWGGGYEAPNPLRSVSGALVFVVRGPSGGPDRAAVLGCERSV